jgi:hypothetical protein
MKSKAFLFAIFSFAISIIGHGQILDKENVIDIAKKTAYSGYPSDIRINDQEKKFELIYTTKEKKKELRRNRLVFDYDLNLLDDIQEVISLRDKIDRKTETSTESDVLPKNYRGEEFSNTELRIAGMSGGKIEKVETKYTYNWTSQSYEKETNVLEEVKVKALIGKPGSDPYAGHYNNEDGDLIYLSGTVDPKRIAVLNFKAHKINANLEKELMGEWGFDYVQRPFFAGFLDNNGELNPVYIYANAGGKIYKKKINMSPEPNEWTYVRLGPNGELLNTAKFKTKANNWQILGVKEKDGSVFVYGPGESKGVGEKHQDVYAAIGTGKQDVFQILKVTGNNVDFVAGPTLDEINDKVSIPAGQKKAEEYDGKRVVFENFSFAENGDIFINAQDYGVHAKVGKPLYKSLFMFHFGSDGSFKRLYSIASQKNNSGLGGVVEPLTDARFWKDEGEVVSGPSGAMYWATYTAQSIAKSIDSWTVGNYEYTQTTYIPQYTGAIAKFDPENGVLEAYNELGTNQFYLYAIPSRGIPSIRIDNGTKMIFLGYGNTKETRKQIWLGRLDPLKL